MGAVDFQVIVIEFHLTAAFGTGICQRQDVAEIAPGHGTLQPNLPCRFRFQSCHRAAAAGTKEAFRQLPS